MVASDHSKEFLFQGAQMSFDYTHSSDEFENTDDPALALADVQSLLQRSHPARLNADIKTALRIFGQVSGADRAIVFQIKDILSVQNTHEWCTPGIKPIQAELKDTQYDTDDIFWSAFRRAGILVLNSVASVPADADIHLMLEQQEIKSLIAAPIWSADEITGFVRLDYCQRSMFFTPRDIGAIRSLAASLGAALERRSTNIQLTRLGAALQTAKDKISALVTALPELLIETDKDGFVISFHQSTTQSLALIPQDVLGLPPEAFLPTNAARVARKAMAQAAAIGWSQKIGYTIELEGQTHKFMLHTTARGQANSPQPQGYLLVIRDMASNPEHRAEMLVT
jgi:PAS domain-containing protein